MLKFSIYRLGTLTVTLTTGAYLTTALNLKDRSLFLPGETTHGHYQIELSCDSCHSTFSGVDQDACVRCHGEELQLAKDTHPKAKFTDPRNSELIERIDARRCVTCHEEHAPERTNPMGVTLPLDFCSHCHSDIAEERPSHRDYDFHSCSSVGCHNFHDNTALYEEFLEKHLDEPDLLPDPRVPYRKPVRDEVPREDSPEGTWLTSEDVDAPADVDAAPRIVTEWERSAHARAGVNCSHCHSRSGVSDVSDTSGAWMDVPEKNVCESCHGEEVKGFLEGRHGMRVAVGLEPMRPGLARLAMKTAAFERELLCTACHGDHGFDTRRAAVEACLECHRDDHSIAYLSSSHHDLWERETEGRLPPGSGVSCATCHLPRRHTRKGGDPEIVVEHNQNAYLRPREKMLRTVCLHCHGLGFSIDSLADPELTRVNFMGRPAVRVESLDLVRRRARSP